MKTTFAQLSINALIIPQIPKYSSYFQGKTGKENGQNSWNTNARVSPRPSLISNCGVPHPIYIVKHTVFVWFLGHGLALHSGKCPSHCLSLYMFIKPTYLECWLLPLWSKEKGCVARPGCFGSCMELCSAICQSLWGTQGRDKMCGRERSWASGSLSCGLYSLPEASAEVCLHATPCCLLQFQTQFLKWCPEENLPMN